MPTETTRFTHTSHFQLPPTTHRDECGPSALETTNCDWLSSGCRTIFNILVPSPPFLPKVEVLAGPFQRFLSATHPLPGLVPSRAFQGNKQPRDTRPVPGGCFGDGINSELAGCYLFHLLLDRLVFFVLFFFWGFSFGVDFWDLEWMLKIVLSVGCLSDYYIFTVIQLLNIFSTLW